MTLMRRVAMRISGVVVHYASAGCKEWAEGLAREVEFIESDWSALWWAVGSMRVLLDRREATVGSLREAAAKARQFSKSLRNGGFASGRILAAAFISFEIYYTLSFLDARNVQQRVWCGVVILTAIYLEIFMARNVRRRLLALVPPSDDDAVAWALYYKAELEYLCSRDLLMGSFIPLILLNTSVLLGERVGIRVNPIVGMSVQLIFVCLTLVLFWKRRQYQGQITALDAILQELS
jgi:hypothetical protein